MDILYLLRKYPAISQSFILNEIHELERRGHSIYIFALDEPDSDIKHTELSNIRAKIQYSAPASFSNLLKYFPPRAVYLYVLKHSGPRNNLKRQIEALFYAGQCIRFLKNISPSIDVVHTHFADFTTVPSRYVASYFGIPSTVTAHAFDLYNNPEPDLVPHYLSSMDRIITISDYNKNFISNLIDNSPPIDVVHAGIRPEKFTPTEGTVTNRIFTVSRLVEKKGILDAIHSVSSAVERISSLEYHIAGTGEMRSRLEQKINVLGLADNIKLLGSVSDARLIEEYQSAEIFLLPSVIADSGDRDGIPVVLMEAMAMKTPPVSTTVSGIPELITHRENGLLVEPHDISAIADSVTELLMNNEYRKALGCSGRATVIEEYNISNEVKKLEASFESAIERV